MPVYPDIEEHKPGDPIDLSNIQYSWGERLATDNFRERFTSALSNTYEHNTYNLLVNNSPMHVKPQEGYPGTFPTTQDDISLWKKDRPDLAHIPLGTPKFIGLATVSMYDNDKKLKDMEEMDPSYLGKAGAFGGSIVGSFTDIKALIAAASGGAIASKAVSTIAKSGMEKFGASELFGSKASQVGTQIMQRSAEFGGANIGYQTVREAEEQESKQILQQPHDYLQSLQNIGTAGYQGVIAGTLFELLGVGLLGVKGTVNKAGGFEYRAPLEGETPARSGGIFNRKEFDEIPQEHKEIIADNFKPWSNDADVTMTEEASGQMFNGQTVKVDPIMRQGIVDEGATFRQAMRDGNIDVEMLDNALSEAHDNVKADLSDAIKQSEELRQSTKKLEAGEELAITEEKDLSQAGILRRAERAQFEESIMKQSPELVPENVRKNIETQKEIKRLNDKLEEEAKRQPSVVTTKPELGAQDIVREPAKPNKKVIKRIEYLKNRMAKILTPKEELQSLKKQLMKQAGTPDYGTGEAYQRLSQLANVWKAAKQLKENLDLSHNFEGRIGELSAHDAIISMMRDHLNDTHEPVTRADMKDYADQLQSPGIPKEPDVAAEFEPKPEKDIDAYLQEYPPEDLRSITEKLNDDLYTKELERSAKRLSMIPTMRSMVKNMTDCLLKGAE